MKNGILKEQGITRVQVHLLRALDEAAFRRHLLLEGVADEGLMAPWH